MKYSDKLRDPRWQKKRLEVMQRDDFTCLACGDKDSTLNVHHKQYHGDPWEAPMSSLETLCESCHGARSNLNKDFLALDTRETIKFARILEASYTGSLLRSLTKIICEITKDYVYLGQDKFGHMYNAKERAARICELSRIAEDLLSAIQCLQCGNVKGGK
jgi:hypothetical protein